MPKMVTMKHPDGSGETTTVPEIAFQKHWSLKGWELVEGQEPEEEFFTDFDDDSEPTQDEQEE